tara:strand:+ start:1309 stop:1416 length:108 start_codon:yes stop_codon:yes gene_type:complete
MLAVGGLQVCYLAIVFFSSTFIALAWLDGYFFIIK